MVDITIPYLIPNGKKQLKRKPHLTVSPPHSLILIVLNTIAANTFNNSTTTAFPISGIKANYETQHNDNSSHMTHRIGVQPRGDNLPARPRVSHQLTGSKVLRLLRWRRRSASRQVVAPPPSSLSGFGECACLRLDSVLAPLYS